MNRRLLSSLISAAAVIIAVVLYLLLRAGGPIRPGSPSGRTRADSGIHLTMGTFARIVAIAPDTSTGSKCVEAALDRIDNVDALMSDYKEDSELTRVNKGAFARPVKVGPETFEVIQRSIEFSKLSNGAFDITVGPLVKLFRESRKTSKAPTDEQIAEAKSKVGYEKLIIDEDAGTIRFTVEGMSLDLGGIAKGYAAETAIQALKQGGALGALVDIGGDVRCFGIPPKGREKWLIGLQDPNAAEATIAGLLLKLEVAEGAVTTSGDYQQFAIIDGQRQSHILDRKTGKSATGLSSVTIIAPDATDADALATAVTVLGPEKGLELIEKIPNTEAILISSAPKYEMMTTTGADKYIK
ncbi:MAG: FAD:protein FMN transferase [Sedimentisphaerales bacterium]|nr:FAD:protein FMN transferase [Sedimentisphaerales bacterium]